MSGAADHRRARRRPRLLLPPSDDRDRRGSRSPAAAPSAGLADLARGITDAALVSRELEPGDPPGLRITGSRRAACAWSSNKAQPGPGRSPARSCRTSSPGARPPGPDRRGHRAPIRSSRSTLGSRHRRGARVRAGVRRRLHAARTGSPCHGADCPPRRATTWRRTRPRSATWTWPHRPGARRSRTRGAGARAPPCATAATRRGGRSASSPAAAEEGAAQVPALDADEPDRPPRDRRSLHPGARRPLHPVTPR